MSLRARLTLVYTSVLGGVFIIFGVLVYSTVNVVLLDLVDTTLSQSANQLIERLRVNSTNQFDQRSIINFQTTENLLFQVWGSDRRLQLSRPSGIQKPLDEVGQRAGVTMFNSTYNDVLHLRVLSVPFKSERGPAGVLQVAINLSLVDATVSSLLSTIFLLTLFSMLLAGLGAWEITRQSLAPLTTLTRVATQITRADDLSRRIAVAGSHGEEIDDLISAFNQTLERLEHLFTAQRRFMADVSHELRTPLTVIKGNVGLIRKMGPDEESLESIESEVDRLTRMVGDLLLLAQAESGRIPLDLSPVELDTVLLEVFQQMRVLAGERIRLRISEIDQVQVIGDRDRLKQVLLNLVGNAVQYTPAGGEIILALRKSNEQAQVIVTDNGPGIPAADLPHIFERFYRGEKSRKRTQSSGFGLGLSIAHWIVRNHGGRIDVSSQEGKGSTFSILLPLAGPEQDKPKEAKNS